MPASKLKLVISGEIFFGGVHWGNDKRSDNWDYMIGKANSLNKVVNLSMFGGGGSAYSTDIAVNNKFVYTAGMVNERGYSQTLIHKWSNSFYRRWIVGLIFTMSGVDDVLILDSELNMPFMRLPVKMVLVKISGGGVVLISPLPDIKRFTSDIEGFGRITDIVAPNLYHNIGIEAATRLYPDAKLWGVTGYDKKMSHFNWNFLDGDTWPYSDVLSLHEIKGMPKFNEVEFLHKKSKTLIVTDLCFNHLHGKGFGNWFVFHIFDTYKRFAISRLFLKMVKERSSFEGSIKEILNLDFDKIILSHGVNVEHKAKEKFIDALRERGICYS
ncbi:MAG: DUF4336 domain-containing protein [Bdellovibrionota bacterium]